MVSLKNTVKINNVIQNKQFTLHIVTNACKGSQRPGNTLTEWSSPLILTKHLGKFKYPLNL